MAAQTLDHEDRTSSRIGSVFVADAVLLWLMTVGVGVVGGSIVFMVSEYEGGFFPWYLMIAVPFGLLLGAAVIATSRATGRQGSISLVLVVSLVAALMLHGVAGFVGQQRAEQTAGEACSVERLAEFESLDFYDDLDQPPTGTRFDSCYALYTIDETGQQAWVDLQQLLVSNGWQHTCEPDCPADINYRYQVLYRDGFVLSVREEGSHDLPGDALAESPDGATTFALDIRPSPCSQEEVEVLRGVYNGLDAAAGYAGGPGPGIDVGGLGPHDRCVTTHGFEDSDQAQEVLLEAMTRDGWTLTWQDAAHYTFQRGDDTVEATITEHDDPEELSTEVSVSSMQ